MIALRDPARHGELRAIVLAGGSGRRLAPLTRRWMGEPVPKQYCSFGRPRSLLQDTIDRVAPMIPGERVAVVIDRGQRYRARPQLGGYRGIRVVEQPCDRGTAAGVLLPLLRLERDDPDSRVVLLASDHGIANVEAFLATLSAANAEVQRSPEAIVLVGAEPEAANTDYGWIVRAGRNDAVRTPDPVLHFVEKPSSDTASGLFESRFALWNTMVLVARTRTLVRQFETHLGDLAARLRGMIERFGVELPRSEYETLPRANFSSDLVARAGGLRVLGLPVSAGWTDLGTEERMTGWLAKGADASIRTPRLVRAPQAAIQRIDRFTISAAAT